MLWGSCMGEGWTTCKGQPRSLCIHIDAYFGRRDVEISSWKNPVTSSRGSGRQGVKGFKPSVRTGSRAVMKWKNEVKLFRLDISMVSWVALASA